MNSSATAVSADERLLEVAPGIFRVRLALPFRLNHVNCYVLDDRDGWTVFDTGYSDDACKAVWSDAFGTKLRGRPVKRVIVSHCHVDHVGLASWFMEQHAPLFCMTQTDYLLGRTLRQELSEMGTRHLSEFLRSNGLLVESATKVAEIRLSARKNSPFPPTFHRLMAGQTISIGGRNWLALTGGGHSVEQLMLYCTADRILMAADQILPKITPNISVGPLSPSADPLADFLSSLNEVRMIVPSDALVLPGHYDPFTRIDERIGQLEAHHRSRCDAVLQACQHSALSARELIPVVFGREIDQEVLASAIGETVAHINYLVARGLLKQQMSGDIFAYRTV